MKMRGLINVFIPSLILSFIILWFCGGNNLSFDDNGSPEEFTTFGKIFFTFLPSLVLGLIISLGFRFLLKKNK